jgi:alpha-L-fucosidase
MHGRFTYPSDVTHWSLTVAAATLLFLIAAPPSICGAQGLTRDSSPTWEELRSRPYPQWFRDAKLGIFIHWGVYSVPSYSGAEQYGEWFLRGLQVGDTLRTRFMREHYGEDFTYRDFAPLFRAELFDPHEWAELFRRAGARYVVLVSKHHDGYALWPSRYAPNWNSVEVGPKRDIVGELAGAVRAAGLRMGLYYSLAEWNNPLHRWYTDPPDSIAPYVDRHMVPQFKELIEAYRPVVLFSDGDWSNTAEQWHARELIGWYFNTVGPDAIVNDRWGGGSDIGFLTPEYSAGLEVSDRPWAEVRGLGRSFALNRNEKLDAYMQAGEVVHRLASAVAAGGGMILNVGPKADGQIPLLQQERLQQLGEWLAVNGTAIYGAEPWEKTGEEHEVSLVRVDSTIDFDWVRNSPGRPIKEDDFTAVWAGYLEAPSTETYTFDAEADDEVHVWINGALVLSRGPDNPTAQAVSVALDAGSRYEIRVSYQERKQNAHVRLFWTSPTRPRAVIPARWLSTEVDGRPVRGLTGTYRSMQHTVAYTRTNQDLFAILLEWPDGELALPIPAPATGSAVRMLGVDRDLVWRYASDTVYVDLTGISYRELPTPWAWTIHFPGYLVSHRD